MHARSAQDHAPGAGSVIAPGRPDQIIILPPVSFRDRVTAWMEGRSPYLFELYSPPDPYQWFDPEQGRK